MRGQTIIESQEAIKAYDKAIRPPEPESKGTLKFKNIPKKVRKKYNILIGQLTPWTHLRIVK